MFKLILKIIVFSSIITYFSNCQEKKQDIDLEKIINKYSKPTIVFDTVVGNTIYFVDKTKVNDRHGITIIREENSSISIAFAGQIYLAEEFKRPHQIASVDGKKIEVYNPTGQGLNGNSYSWYERQANGIHLKTRVIKNELTFGSERISINNDTLQTGDTLMVYFKAHPLRREDTMFYRKEELYGELEDYSFYVTNKDSINNPFVDTVFFCRENKQRNFVQITYKKICQQTGIHTITGICHLKYYLRKKFIIPFEYTYLVLPKEDEE